MKGHHSIYGFYNTAFNRYFGYPYVNVGTYPYGATPEGVMDMVGYLLQWCSDAWSPEYYARSPRDNPTGPDVMGRRDEDVERSARGFTWNMKGRAVPASSRSGFKPASLASREDRSQMGFRIVMETESEEGEDSSED